jgi:hypothetical protein
MTIQEALQKAREGGYPRDAKPQDLDICVGVLGLHAFRTLQIDECFLDPEFWRALGPTLGWQHERVWRGQWQRFIDHLAQGKTPASFFATL